MMKMMMVGMIGLVLKVKVRMVMMVMIVWLSQAVTATKRQIAPISLHPDWSTLSMMIPIVPMVLKMLMILSDECSLKYP
jgi:hypothetical protein